MNSIVRELQRESLNPDTELPDLLRKAYVVAKKLKINDFEAWIKLELYGYYDTETPSYRKLHGQPKYYNPVYERLTDYIIENQKIHDSIAIAEMNTPIAELEDLYQNSNGQPLVKEIPPGIRKIFRDSFKTEFVPEKLFVSPYALRGIFDSVRNIILEWSLKLEEDGILGENLHFSEEEEEIAHKQINNYNTLVYQSQVQVGNGNIQNINEIDLTETNELLQLLISSLDELGLNNTNKEELKLNIETMESQLKSQNPNKIIVKEGLKSIRNILEGCTSSAIAPTLIVGIMKIIGL